jgi:hypothetical protein
MSEDSLAAKLGLAKPELRERLDKMINSVMLLCAAQCLSRKIMSRGVMNRAPVEAMEIDSSIHPDGVYDMDTACMTKVGGEQGERSDGMALLLMLAALRG